MAPLGCHAGFSGDIQLAKDRVKIIPLGGVAEVGKNITVFEYKDDIIIVDVGVGFPEEDMLGVDLVIPDIAYLRDKVDRIRGIVITHGHEDHIGSLPYVLEEINAPIYSTRLTAGMISNKLRESRLLGMTELHVVETGDHVQLGAFDVEFFHVCHSIPDGAGLIIRTPVGTIVHSETSNSIRHLWMATQPIMLGWPQLGEENVLVLLSDVSTSSRPATHHPSE